MSPNPFQYRVLPPEVMANTHDFEVRRVVHNGKVMRGVFPRHSIDTLACSLFVGVYPGHRKSRQENALKIRRYAARHAVDELAATRITALYNLSLKNIDPGFILDPTDDEGNLTPEFVPYIVSYINEPPPEYQAKSVFVYNRPRQRYEVWLLQAVEPDEEIFLFYGRNYMRDYPFSANTNDSRYSYTISAESIFIPDQRGIPALLDVPDLVSEFVTI
jgi:hypothetical protein